MREVKVNGVSLNADYWATQTVEDFVRVNSQYWPGLDEEEKKNLLLRVWPYIIDHEPDQNERASSAIGSPSGAGGVHGRDV